MFGLNWDITPPVAQTQPNPTISGLWTGTALEASRTTDVARNAPWPMRFGQFSPRLGAAYRVPGSPLVLRAGAGLFRDSSLGATLNPINGAPFDSWLQTGTGRLFGPPPTVDNSASPDVQQFLNGGAYPPLRFPSSYQWRLSAERQFENRGVGSLAYVGAQGRNLLGNQTYLDPQTGAPARTVTLTENSSSYDSLQARYSGAVTRRLFLSASYTWSHSIDDGSLDSCAFLIHPQYRLAEARGSSNFDVRHAFTLALSHQIAGATLPGLAARLDGQRYRSRPHRLPRRHPDQRAAARPVLRQHRPA